MRLFWLQKLTLLIFIQLLELNRTSLIKSQAEATLGFERIVSNCQQRPSGVSSPSFPFEAKILGLSSRFDSRFSREDVHKANGHSNVPMLSEAHNKVHKKKKIAAIIGGAIAALLIVVVVSLVYVCLMRFKRYIRRTSESASSVPSMPAEWERGSLSPYAMPLSPFETLDLREVTYSELEQATGNFSRNNIINEGRFGLAYKGLLQDGSIVAIKRRQHAPTRSFFHQVKQIARVQHANLVRLIGYYHDTNQQLLVYEYLSNGNVGHHLYDSAGLPIGKLGIRQRLSIALGAAKGLGHLHSLVPPFIHMHFRTRNVLLDDSFAAKVSDFGLTRLLIEGNHSGSSSSIDYFIDPELDTQNSISERSDVYSFGVFLLELMSGHEANSEENLISQAKRREAIGEFVDKSLGKQSMHAVKWTIDLGLMCVDFGLKRPAMKLVVEELERIHESEMARLSSELDVQISSVTLGSELFK